MKASFTNRQVTPMTDSSDIPGGDEAEAEKLEASGTGPRIPNADRFRLMMEHKRSVAKVSLFVGIPLVCAMAINNFIKDDRFMIFSNSMELLILILLGFVNMRRIEEKSKYKLYSILFRMFIAVVGISLLYNIGFQSNFSRIEWCYAYPLLVFFALGVKEGAIWVSIFYGILVYLILHFDLQGITLSQIQELRSRFLFSFFALSILFLFFEYGFRRSRDELFHHQSILKESENRYRQAYEQLNIEMQERKQAEEALRRSEERYRTIVENIEEGYYEVDLAGNFIFVNDTAQKHLGYSAKELVGMNYRQYWDEKTARELYQAYNTVYSTGKPSKLLDVQLIRKDGTKRFFELLASLIKDSEGKPIGFRGVSWDVTERKQSEEAVQRSEKEARRLAQENAVIAEIGRIISSSLDIDEVYERFAEEVHKLISFDRIVINNINIEKNTVINVYMAGKGIADRSTEKIYPLEGSGNAEMVHTQSTLLVQTEDFDAYKDRFPMLWSTFQAGFRSIMNVPLFSKGRIIGGLLLRSFKPHAYTERDVRLAEKIGNQISGAIATARLFTERKQAEEALSVEKQRFQTVSENAPFGIALIDQDGTYKYVNPKFIELFGYDLNDIPNGKAWYRKAYPDPAYRHHAISVWINDNLSWSPKPGEKISRTFTVTCKDGTEKIINFFPVKLETGEYLTSFVDFTIHKKAEDALRRSEEEAKRLSQENAIMAEIGRISSSTLNIEEVYERFVEEVHKLIPFDRISISTINPKDRSATVVYTCGVEVPHRKQGEVFTLTGSFYEKILATRSGILIQTEDESELAERYPTLLKTFRVGIRSMLSVPLISKDQVIGILNIRSLKTNAYTETDLRLAEKVGNQIAGAIVNAQLFIERKRAGEALKKSEDHLKKLMDSIKAGIIVIDAETHQIVEMNSFALEMIGGGKEQILGRICHQCICPAEAGKCPITDLKQKVDHSERVLIKSNRDRIPILKSVVPIMREDKVYLIESFIDITELKRAEQEKISLEEQLRQSQKMEAIGKLAGGVAHDFNNLLTVIHGYSELLLNSLDQNNRLRQDVQEIMNASKRASSLTHQLLAFSRKQVLQPKVLDLNAHVSSMDKMLRRTIGENIELVSLLAKDLGRIKADPGQIEQVILNLAVNAKDAMPNGGKLTIETANVVLDESYARSRIGVIPGRYVMLSVSDTGSGMTPETKERIFEPFFTTKEKGKGIGLGLSTVYGIIQQSGGDIWVYSEPGVGTTFKIYLPTIEEGTESLRPTAVPTKSTQGFETILLVEDEEMVRKLACTVLQKNGYTVLEASNGEEALRIVQGQNGNPIHLMVTDVVMPGMSGRQLAERLLPLRPEMKVLYMSGYTDDAIVHHGVLDPGIAYIQKPFAPDAFASKVREILDI